MKTPAFRLIALGLIGLIQIATPLTMIARREITLRQGKIHRFRAAPVDPYDPFRGRYVTIAIASRTASISPNHSVQRGDQVAVSLVTSADGFTSCSMILDSPKEDDNWLWARVQWVSTDTVHLELPFDRYYMNEQLAPAAERLYWQHQRSGRENADPVWVSVRIHQGQAVLERLMIGEQPIEMILLSQTEADSE